MLQRINEIVLVLPLGVIMIEGVSLATSRQPLHLALGVIETSFGNVRFRPEAEPEA